MGAEYYLFALFIFALAAMLIVLVLRGKAKNKEKNEEERDEQEKKVMMLYFEVEDMIEALKEYVETSRERIESDIRRMETDMQALSAMREGFAAREEKAAPLPEPVIPDEDPVRVFLESVPAESAADQRSGLILTAANLRDQGKNIDQIAEIMHLSKTEVSFMLNLGAYGKPADKTDKPILKKD